MWLAEERRRLPEPFAPSGARDRAADGTEYRLRARTLELDPLRQLVTFEMHAEQWRDEELVAQETHAITVRLYLRNELLLLLEHAGFVDVTVRGDYTDEEASADHQFLVFTAKRP